MKLLVFVAALTLVICVNATKQLSCKADKGSLLYFMVSDRRHSFECIAEQGDFHVSAAQYNDVIKRLNTAENEIATTRSELSKLTKMIEHVFNATGIPLPTMTYTSPQTTTTMMPTQMPKSTPSPAMQRILRTWTRSGNMYYKYFRHDTVYYNTAKQRCEQHGARLASTVLRDPRVIGDLENAGFVNSKIFSSWLWIGYNDIVTEGTWIWSDGGETNKETTTWWPNEPNQFRGTNEDCGCIIALENSKILLNDAPCSFYLQYMCEIEIPDAFLDDN